ncbi:MAG: tetratricopeptide repeat protein [Hylemonella sp.]|uniref:YybH family protein n=1 Tax=Hylemonella sp. TaxID=2066020 RepID=UPI00391CDD5C
MKHGLLLSPRALLGLALAGLLGLAHANDPGEISQLLREGRLAEAQTRVDRLLAAKPRDPQLRLYKGVIQRETGRTQEALATFTKLSEDHPELPEPYNNLAVIHAAQGQYDKARVVLEKALRTHPSYATAHDNLADVYARLASQAYSKALQLDGAAPSPARLALIRDLGPVSGVTRPATVVATAPAAPPAPAAAVKPAAPPPAAVVAAPIRPATPAPAAPSAPAAAPADGAREVEQAVRAWAQAWSDRDMNRYLAAYDAGFETPGRQGRSAWEQERRARIVSKSRISVQLLDLQITVQGQRAVAKFRQDYKADTLAVLSRKTLELTRTGNRWLIVKESSGS